MKSRVTWRASAIVLGMGICLMACGLVSDLVSTPGPTPTNPSATAVEAPSPTQAKYLLIDEFGEPFFCDPDYYPVGRGDELPNALQWLAQADVTSEEVETIFARLTILRRPLSEEEALLAYRQHKLLASIPLEQAGGDYRFEFRTGEEPEGETLRGRIDAQGQISVESREPSFNTCPICLAAGTLIDTPEGPMAVQDLRPGMMIWTSDLSGARTEAVILRTGSAPVPVGFELVRFRLEDGRELVVSPGHPLGDGRPVGAILAGEVVDGARVVSVERVPTVGPATYDLLPAGGTGLYWANGILVRSTLWTPRLSSR